MGLPGLFRSERAQTSPLGVALIFGIVIAGTVSVVVFGSAALTSTEQSAELGQAEHTMSQFDSLSAQVALGDAPVQSLQVGGGTGGGYSTDPDAGRIVIIHANFSGTDADHEIYNETMGAVVYRNGNDEIAYQGGGVWRKGGTGAARMVSPPEFHYRAATLTFPVIRVNPSGSSGGASGAQTMVIRRASETQEVFPNRSDGYPDTDGNDDGFANASYPYNGNNDGDGDGGAYLNPQENGTIVVKVQSEYYQAWGQYFRDRTTGDVRVYDSNETVLVELISLGTGEGAFSMPNEGSPIEVRGLKPQGHALNSFEIELRADQNDSADFNNLQWSLRATEDDEILEVHIRKGQDDSANCGTTVDISMYYTDDGGTTYHGWHGDDTVTVQCSGGSKFVIIDLAQSPTNVTYQELTNKNLQSTNPQSKDLVDNAIFDEHPSVGWESSTPTYTEGADDTEEFGRLFSHYMALLGPDIDLVVDDKDSDTISESASSGNIDYEGTGQFVTFLHVSENEVEVEFE